MKKTLQRKLITGLFISLIVFITSYGVLMKPKQAQAQGFELGAIMSWGLSDLLGAAADTWLNEHTWESLITDLAKRFVIKFVYDDLVKWISGEQKGKPNFISDFDDWLFKQADEAASIFLEQMMTTAYQALCTGINVNLALYWKPQFDVQYYIPKCTLSDIQRRFQNPGTEWVDFQVYLDNSNNDAGFLFQAYSKAQEKKDAIQYEHFTKVLSGLGFVQQKTDADGKEILTTPGSVTSGTLTEAQTAPIKLITTSNSWEQIGNWALSAIMNAALKRGINTVKSKINK